MLTRLLLASLLILTGCATRVHAPEPAPPATIRAINEVQECFPGSCDIPAMTDEEVKAVLTPEAYAVMREAGTERPFTSPLNDENRAGTYVAADTGEPLFRSEAKFDSGTGWPSFFQPINPDVLVLKTDRFLFYDRTEVQTRNGSHLGHVFDDGPEPTGLRYCINGLALRFVPDSE